VASLEAPAEASHFYQVTCSNDGSGDPASLVTQVRVLAPAGGALVAVQTKRANEATNTTDPAPGDSSFSPLVWVDQGAGVYQLFVDKTGAGEKTYQLFFECRTGEGGAGVATGTSISPEPPAPTPVPALAPIALLCLAAILLVGGAASADTQTGSLAEAASATDYYHVTCSGSGTGTPASLVAQVRDTTSAAPPLVSVQIRRGSGLANSTDPIGGDGNASPLVYVNGGAVVFDLLVDKSGAGFRSYVLTFHCLTGPNGTGLHTGTSIATQQNQ
jgi:hypothetical protein